MRDFNLLAFDLVGRRGTHREIVQNNAETLADIGELLSIEA